MTTSTLNLKTIKVALTNQIAVEKKMGADERDLQLLTNVFADLYKTLTSVANNE